MKIHAFSAVFRRNLLAYFSNPTGYVFICVFVALSSAAAFWPPEFFNANLANLAELNHWFPLILLFFIPAITMSIWADERRQGTDELLLTLPATDSAIVLGKYFAALAIFLIALMFSSASNWIVLRSLGNPDPGLFISNYTGYFFIGMAMLATGMVASFLTSNLTVAFVLGALFNVPLVVLQFADVLIPFPEFALRAKTWSIGETFGNFGRGVVSFAAIVYFVMIAVAMVYVSLVLIGRRHWLGGQNGRSLIGHFVARGIALGVIAVGLSFFFRQHDVVRLDLTSSRLNSISPQTRKLIQEITPKQTIDVEVFVSPSVPERYVQTRMDLVSLLNEMKQQAGDKMVVRIYEAEPFSDVAKRAAEEYGIRRKTVRSKSRGTWIESDVILGAAFRCGLDKIVVPFFELGVPVEYELIRSISTVAQAKRKKLGIVTTDAALMGGGMSPPQKIVDELKRQYEVVAVDPTTPIVDPQKSSELPYDVLLVVQPSSLAPNQLPNVLHAIRAGIPTAIFEDPFPAWMRHVVGTNQPKQPPGHNFMMPQQRPAPKCDIRQLWDLLGVRLLEGATSQEAKMRALRGGGMPNENEALIVWQAYNPYPKLRQRATITNEWVFANINAPGAASSFNNEEPAVSRLKEVLFLLPGAIVPQPSRDRNLKFTQLITTGKRTGKITFDDLIKAGNDPYDLRNFEEPTGDLYTLAARIHGTPKAPASAENDDKPKAPQPPAIDVILVSDIDLMDSTFVDLRAEPIPELDLHFQNVTFVLNALDALANDDRFIEIRKREQDYRTLSRVETQLNVLRDQAEESIKKYRDDFRKETDQTEQEMRNAIDSLKAEVARLQKQDDIDQKQVQAAVTRLALRMQVEERREKIEKERLKQTRDEQIKKNNDELELKTRRIQDHYKLMAVSLPPIPPLVLALIVFLLQRRRERRGVAESRLR